MPAIRTILMAIKDPEAKAHPGLDKAVQLARGLGARLELFHALTSPVYANSEEEFRQITLKERRAVLQRLEHLAARIRTANRRVPLRASVAVEWDHPAYEAVVRRAATIGADLIVAERHLGTHVAPALLHFNDWELLRQSPVPLLIVKRAGLYQRPPLLAAVDPSHQLDKPAELDRHILDLGTALSAALAGRVHCVHAYRIVYDRLRPEPYDAKSAERINGQIALAARKRYYRLLRPYRVPLARRHLMGVEPADAIESVAARIDAQLVVLGALSRTGWKRLLVGNTAEAILDPLRCDLLIVKPRGFKTQVARSSRGARLVPVSSLMVA